MRKKTISSSAVLATTGAASGGDGRVGYHVRPGVAWVNGKRVGDAKTVSLNSDEAAYDLSLDRISPESGPLPASWTDGSGDGGN